MISLISELTDGKGRHARGWLFYDAECGFCTRIAARLEKPIRRRNLALAPLQDLRVATLLGLSRDDLLQAIRYLDPNGKQHAGAGALVALAREFWWARPVIWFARMPGGLGFLSAFYGWIARRRNCQAGMHCDRVEIVA
jgi:predicted DCC family thiol-disulfide oxidoreductase YuxK